MGTGIAPYFAMGITVALFALSQWLVVRTSRRAAKVALVQSVLEALASVARTHARPAIARLWTKPEIEYALLVPQLLVGLPEKDRILAVWVNGRVQDMLAATTQGEVVRIASDISGKLADWQLGTRPRIWFTLQVADHQPQPVRSGLRATATAAEATGGVALIVAACALTVKALDWFLRGVTSRLSR